MKRILLSIAGGTAITSAPLLLAGFLSVRLVETWFFALLLYWPSLLIDKLGPGFDCANANSVAEKLNCAGLCLIIDVISYSLLIYAFLNFYGRRRRLP
jgi:hypothetical protein